MYFAWSLPDWFSVIGFPITIAGLVLGAIRLRKAREAAVAAREAVERTERQLADNHLLLILPRLAQARRDLRRSAHAGEREATYAAIDAWREAAIRVRELIRAKGDNRPVLLKEIERAVALIPPAEEALSDNAVAPLDGTKHLRGRIDEAVDEAENIVTERMAFTDTKEAVTDDGI